MGATDLPAITTMVEPTQALAGINPLSPPVWRVLFAGCGVAAGTIWRWTAAPKVYSCFNVLLSCIIKSTYLALVLIYMLCNIFFSHSHAFLQRHWEIYNNKGSRSIYSFWSGNVVFLGIFKNNDRNRTSLKLLAAGTVEEGKTLYSDHIFEVCTQFEG